MKTFKRQEPKNFTLEAAIFELFPNCLDVVKRCDFGTCGTIEVDGLAFDWFMKPDRFNFTPV
jgi:hypothetical protein